ncbi:hypothetical protein BC936DRAFT_139714 [Jimgerdemannia flammicorona]|uniref:Uncharacterized protein n=2 Tax=Jimgerdemannia flammicorona TaxID=994334 RepID=A0A433Q486_9FUNG|nr:hypothetical protein BC936DRAFT_139714 [Jimgerdemannia flammicorona]RUS24600.1 hypothetical protein BC938DRAFT_473342 [Jimgerdemannia flammicorona]
MSYLSTRIKIFLFRLLYRPANRRALLLALALVTIAFLTLFHRASSIPAAASKIRSRVAAVAVKRSEVDDQHILHRDHPHHREEVPLKKIGDDTERVVLAKPGETFITYLPHSGFNNQRIELENAILLAHYLNRTLIVPPVFLGDGIQWRPFDDLSEFFAVNRTRSLSQIRRCSNAARRFGPPVPGTPTADLDPDCVDFASWTTLPWSFFFDFNKLSDTFGMRFVHRSDLHPRWFTRALAIQDPQSSPQIRYIKDTLRNDYRIYDLPGFNPNLGKYSRKLFLDRLALVRAPVMHFGSLFGNGRVRVDVPAHKVFYGLLESSLILSNPTLHRAAMDIVNQLGGKGRFVALHVRLGDGYFSQHIDKTLKAVITALDKAIPNPLNTRRPQSFHLRPTSVHDRLDYCRKAELPVLYMATDAPNPAFNQRLKPLYVRHAFCIFTYAEFPYAGWLDVDNSPALGGAADGVKLRPFLEPLVDGIVAGFGSQVIGTPGSTFSAFVERLNEAWVGGARKQDDKGDADV